MNRLLGLVMFLTLFAAIYFGMHYYVFSKAFASFGKQLQPSHLALIFLLVLLFPISAFLERTSPSSLSKGIYVLSAIWLGIVFIAFSFTLLAIIVSLIFPAKSALIIKAGLLISLLLSGYALFNASRIHVEEVVLPIHGLKRPLSIAHLTDMHLGTLHHAQYLSKVVGIVNSLNPDMVVITGDLFDSSRHITEEDIKPLNDITAKMFYVTGNHENYYGLDEAMALLSKTSVVVLRNKVVSILGVQIIGIDHPLDDYRGNRDISKISFNKSAPSILLYHAPVGLEEASNAGVALQLSGHTHAGQIFPFNLFVNLFYKVSSGISDYKGMKIYVSPGAGTWGPPMRLGSRNTIPLVRLVPEE